MAGKWTLVLGLETEFNGDHTVSESHIFHHVLVSWERSDKWPNELIAECFLPLNQQARNLKHYIFGEVGQNEILICPSPRSVVLMDKRFDVKSRLDYRRSRHGCLLERSILHPLRFEAEF